jgi:hypothetical protein
MVNFRKFAGYTLVALFGKDGGVARVLDPRRAEAFT